LLYNTYNCQLFSVDPHRYFDVVFLVKVHAQNFEMQFGSLHFLHQYFLQCFESLDQCRVFQLSAATMTLSACVDVGLGHEGTISVGQMVSAMWIPNETLYNYIR